MPTPGLLLLLMQIEETIALNFDLFSDGELEQLANTSRLIAMTAARTTRRYIRQTGAAHGVTNPSYKSYLAPVAREVVTVCDGITKECEQARYLCAKGALQQKANLEINHDKTRVEEYLKADVPDEVRKGRD